MTIAVDFDGVVHQYSRGWNGGEIYDPPVPGAIEALHELMEVDAVCIFTASGNERRGRIAAWLCDLGVPAVSDSPITEREFWNERGMVLVTSRKYPARAYVDDRGITFQTWEQTMAALGINP